MFTKVKGQNSEAIALQQFIQYGFDVFLPFGEKQDYDMIVDYCGRLYKIQIKTGNLKSGSIEVYLGSVCYRNGKHTRKAPNKNNIDYYFVYCPDNKMSYVIPSNICGGAQLNIRVDHSENLGKHKSYDYEFNETNIQKFYKEV